MTTPVLRWHPLTAPQILFRDKQGETNAFVETNPTFHIDNETGRFLLLVRQVNYRKFHNRAFKMGGPVSNSVYHLFRGTLLPTGDLNYTESTPVSFTNSLPQYESCWHGYEDIRMIDDRRFLCTAPQCSPTGAPVIVEGILDNNIATIHRLCEPSKIEKNWMPFTAGEKTFVLYSVSPLAIKVLSEPTIQELAPALELEGYHGSSNGISTPEGYLFLIHKYTTRTEHRWLLFDPQAKKYGVSAPFTFLPYSYIEFTCSLSEYKGRLYVGLGVNDDKAYLCVLPKPAWFTFTTFK
jgi:hypothetical protein